MNAITYNISLLVGLLLIGAGTAMVSWPLALVSVGCLVLLFTMYSMSAFLRAAGKGA